MRGLLFDASCMADWLHVQQSRATSFAVKRGTVARCKRKGEDGVGPHACSCSSCAAALALAMLFSSCWVEPCLLPKCLQYHSPDPPERKGLPRGGFYYHCLSPYGRSTSCNQSHLLRAVLALPCLSRQVAEAESMLCRCCRNTRGSTSRSLCGSRLAPRSSTSKACLCS